MHRRPLCLILFILHFNLLSPRVHSHPHPFAPSNSLFSFFPSSKASLRSIRKLLTYCCRDAKLISHSRFTLNQLNVLTLPPSQYRILKSLHPQIPSFPKLSIPPSHLPPHLARQSDSQPQSGPSTDYNTYEKYHTFDDLQTKWNDLARRIPAFQTTHIGFSLERRPIVLLKVGDTDPRNPKRIFLNALQHAREWISATSATYVAERLARSTLPNFPTADTELHHLLRYVEVLIVPVVNPDGYVYSHTKEPAEPSPRYWRKNRRPLSAECVRSPDELEVEGGESFAPGGVDLNRNWATDFGGPLRTSTSECHITYIGAEPFSEPETQALSKLLRDTRGIRAHIDFHSFGQVILGPWASSTEKPDRVCEYDTVGEEMERRMIAVHGEKYTYGRGQKFSNEVYAASGVMTDWVHEQFSQTLSYTVELRPNALFARFDGFELDPSEIIPTSREALAAVKALLQYTNDTDGFLNQFSSFAQCKRANEPRPEFREDQGSSKVGLIAGVVVAVVLVAIILSLCLVWCCLKRRRKRENQLEEMSASSHDNTAKEGGLLERVCAVVKLPQALIQAGTVEVQEPSSNETLNAGLIQNEGLSAVSNDCITPVGADESPSAWYNMEEESSYGNTVLLDAQNPFFPGHVTSADAGRSGGLR